MKTLNVDLDGVVYDFEQTLRNYISIKKGMWPFTFASSDRWEMWDAWGIPYGEWKGWFRRAVEEGEVWRKGKAIPGAVKNLWKLSDEGWYIRIVTTRLVHSWAHKEAVTATVEWLDENNVPYRDIAFTKYKAVFATRDAFLVDDKPDNCRLFAAAHPASRVSFSRGLLFDQPWNQIKDEFGIHRVTSWDEVYGYLEGNISVGDASSRAPA